MAETNNNHKNLVVVIIALIVFLVGIYVTKTLPQKYIEDDIPTKPEITQSDESKKAENALTTYFKLLSENKYEEATVYHGSGYDYISQLNEDLAQDDYPSLLQAACESNGFICMEVKKVVYFKEVDGGYSFIIMYQNQDGDVLIPDGVVKPSEVENAGEYDFMVIKSGDDYIVSTNLVFYP